MNRFFAFGCSFTSYNWPTWADILGTTATEYENWGQCGAGNYFIFNSVMECHLRKPLTKDDTVIVMWSNVTRVDTYINDEWITPGNIFNQSFMPKEYINNFVDVKGCILRDFSLIEATRILLESIGCTYYFLSMVDLHDTKNLLNSEAIWMFKDQIDEMAASTTDIYKKYAHTLDTIKPSAHSVLFNGVWPDRPDHHPLPMEHYNYLKVVLPALAAQVSEETIEEMKFIDTFAASGQIGMLKKTHPLLYKKYEDLRGGIGRW